MTLSILAENMNLPAIFCDQLAAGERLTLWSEEVSLIKTKVWDVYQDTPDEFKLRLQIQGFTGSQADNYPLEPLPEDIKAATQMVGFWEIQGNVAVKTADLDSSVVAAMTRFVEWSALHKREKQEESTRPKLWFEGGSVDCGLQLLPKSTVDKKSGKEQLSFSGWAYRGLEWHGKGIGGGTVVEFDASFAKRSQRGARVDAPVLPPAPPAPKVIPPIPPSRGRSLGELDLVAANV